MLIGEVTAASSAKRVCARPSPNDPGGNDLVHIRELDGVLRNDYVSPAVVRSVSGWSKMLGAWPDGRVEGAMRVLRRGKSGLHGQTAR